jgi:hypothetical protein
MGGEFKVDPASLRAAAGQLDEHAGEVASHGETLGANTAGTVGRGAIGEVVESAVKRGIKIVAHDISAAVKKFYADAGTVMRKAAEETERTDKMAGSEFDKLAHGHGESPGRLVTDTLRTDSQEPRVLRQDDNFSAFTNDKGIPKSHLTDDGSMVPPNPEGKTTPLQHIMGMDPAKANSPYTSFLTEGSAPKTYGAYTVELNVRKLQADVATGRLRGVELMSPQDTETLVRSEIHGIASIDIDQALARGPEGIGRYVKSLEGLSGNKMDQLQRRLIALCNATRDKEYLVKGVIPSEYLTGPSPTPGF